MKPVILKPFGREHLWRTYCWLVNSKQLRQSFMMRSKPTWCGHKKYWTEVVADRKRAAYAIYAGGEHVGNCGFKNINLSERVGELWIYIGRSSCCGKGIGKEAVRNLLRVGCDVYGFQDIYLHVGRENDIARRLYTYFGFVRIALAGEWQGRARDVLSMHLNMRSERRSS